MESSENNLSPILGSISTFKTFMCGDLSALKKPEMQIFHWFSFPNFPFVQLSPSPFQSFRQLSLKDSTLGNL